MPLEEHRSHGEVRERLHNHRVVEVRRESRATYLAYGYLRGTPYLAIEPSTDTPECIMFGVWKRVRTMVGKYGTQEQLAGFDAWKQSKNQLSEAA